MKKGLLIVFMTASILFAGCWDYIEYENMALVSALGIDFDKDTGKVTVTAEIIKNEKIGGQGNSGQGQNNAKPEASSEETVLSATDVTIMDSLEKIEQGIGRRLFFGYQQILIVNEDAAINIMDEISGILDRTSQVRNTAYLVISPQNCTEILSIMDTNISKLSSRYIYDLIEISGNSGISAPVSIKDFIQAMAIGGKEAVAPCIVAETYGGTKGNSIPGNGTVREKQLVEFTEVSEGYHIIEGLAAFQGTEFKGWLDRRESLGWSWITGKSLKTYKTTISPDGNYSKEEISFHVT
jgi:spore germination protein KC